MKSDNSRQIPRARTNLEMFPSFRMAIVNKLVRLSSRRNAGRRPLVCVLFFCRPLHLGHPH